MSGPKLNKVVGKKPIASEIDKVLVGEEKGVKKYFVRKKTTTYERDGKIEVESESNFYKCGHSPEKYPNSMQCDYGCIVCENCIRYCQEGNHPVCKMHAKELSEGRIFCKYHSSFKRFFTKPPFIVKRD